MASAIMPACRRPSPHYEYRWENARRPRVIRLMLLLLALPAAAAAQAFELAAGYERQRDRFTYRFEHPSSFDTAELVPHFFVQRYVADNHWGRVRAGYSINGIRLQTTVAAAPQITTYGDDIDTFLQPSGDVVTSGTTGNVSLRSWRVEQRVDLTRGRAVNVYAGYGYRGDRARFHEGHKAVTHTRPPSIERSIVTTRETTWSDVHQMRFGVDATRTSGAWRALWHAEAAPSIARLTVELPDKYPGRLLRFRAAPLFGRTGISVQRSIGGVLVGAGAEYSRAWNYRSKGTLNRDTLSLSASLGWRR